MEAYSIQCFLSFTDSRSMQSMAPSQSFSYLESPRQFEDISFIFEEEPGKDFNETDKE